MIKNKYIAILCALGYCLSANAQHFGWALKAEYEVISDFSEGIAAAKKNGKWGYVTDHGAELLAPAYDVAYPFSEGMGVLASNDNILAAIVDQAGKVIPISERLQIDRRFAAFSNGLLLVNKNNKWGYLNKNGLLTIPCKYDAAMPFSEGLASVVFDRQANHWYYIDVNGNTAFFLSELKKEVWWAFGFHDGKALVLHSKGSLFVDKSGKEQKGNPPGITPPKDPSEYGKETLACNEGILTFDTRCRAVSFTTANGNKTEFIPTPAPDPVPKPNYTVRFDEAASANDELRWLNSSTAIVKMNDAKLGMLNVYDTPVLALSLPGDTLASVFGNPAEINLNVRNASSRKMEKVDIKANDKTFQANSLEVGSALSYLLSLDKMTENETETTDIAVTAQETGLLIGESQKTVWIKNTPSLSIGVPVNKVTLQPGQETYSLKVEVKNLAVLPVNDVVVTIDQQTKTITRIGAGETGSVQFNFPSPKASTVKKLTLSAKPPKTPSVTANVSITIEVPPPPPPPPV